MHMTVTSSNTSATLVTIRIFISWVKKKYEHEKTPKKSFKILLVRATLIYTQYCVVIFLSELTISVIPMFSRVVTSRDKGEYSVLRFQVDSPLYMTVLSLFVYSLEHWNQSKITFLKRLLVTAHARHTNPSGTTKYDLF